MLACFCLENCRTKDGLKAGQIGEGEKVNHEETNCMKNQQHVPFKKRQLECFIRSKHS